MTRRTLMMRLAVRVYGWLLLAQPRAVRNRYRADMLRTFSDALEAARRSGRSTTVEALAECADALRSGIRARRTEPRRAVLSHMTPASSGGLHAMPTMIPTLLEWRRAARRLLSQPGYAFIVVGALALGIGVRVALGARSVDVFTLIVSRGVGLTMVGLGIGLAAAYGLGRYLASQLYEVSTHDPLSFAAVALTLAAISLAACWIPTSRALAIDPAVALRDQ